MRQICLITKAVVWAQHCQNQTKIVRVMVFKLSFIWQRMFGRPNELDLWPLQVLCKRYKCAPSQKLQPEPNIIKIGWIFFELWLFWWKCSDGQMTLTFDLSSYYRGLISLKQCKSLFWYEVLGICTLLHNISILNAFFIKND